MGLAAEAVSVNPPSSVTNAPAFSGDNRTCILVALKMNAHMHDERMA